VLKNGISTTIIRTPGNVVPVVGIVPGNHNTVMFLGWASHPPPNAEERAAVEDPTNLLEVGITGVKIQEWLRRRLLVFFLSCFVGLMPLTITF